MTDINEKGGSQLRRSLNQGYLLLGADCRRNRYFQSLKMSSSARSKAVFRLFYMMLMISASKMDFLFFFFLSFVFWLTWFSPRSQCEMNQNHLRGRSRPILCVVCGGVFPSSLCLNYISSFSEPVVILVLIIFRKRSDKVSVC